jgi:hypothetical protein
MTRPNYSLRLFGLLALTGAVPTASSPGSARLRAAAPIWGAQPEWIELVDRLRIFSIRWHSPAAAAGWTNEQVYGLDPIAPRARVGRMGAAWLACPPGREALHVDAKAITMVTRTSARPSVYRPAEGAALAWELVRR